MDEVIRMLDDAAAQRILARIARSRLPADATPPAWTPDLRQALAEAFAVSPTAQPLTDGELVRQALLLLAEDPATRDAIHAMAATGAAAPLKYDAGTTVAVVTAVLIVLQTYVRFERDKQGKWSVVVEKKPTSEALLKPLVQKLLAYLPKP